MRLSDDLPRAAQVIRHGGVVAYPAEACFGLGCDPQNKMALQRIRKLKSRDSTQGFILVADDLERVLPYVDWYSLTLSQRQKVLASWPGPVSWLIPASSQTRKELLGQNQTLAIRLPAFAPLVELCRLAESPLVSSSANLKGQSPLTSAAQVARLFENEIDCIIDRPIQGLDKPSRIIDAQTLRTIRD